MSFSTGARLAILVVLLGFSLPITLALADTEESARFFEDAQDRLEEGDPRAAVIQLKNALQSDPSNVQARLLLGELYLASGDLDGAEKELERAHDLEPTEVTTVLLGRLYLAQQRLDDALAFLTPNDERTDIAKEHRTLRIEALLADDQVDAAQDEIVAMQGDFPLDVAVAMLDARAELANRNLTAALAKADTAVSIDPESLPARLLKARIALNIGQMFDAERELEVLNKRAPDNLSVNMLEAEMMLAKNDFAAAESLLNELLEVAPANQQARFLLARSYFGLERYREADQLMRQLSEFVRLVPEAMLLDGLIKMQTEQLAQAAEALLDYNRSQPTNVATQRLLAGIFLQLDQPRAAIDVLEPATQRNPNDIETLKALSTAQLRAQDYEGALQTFRELTVRTGGGEAQQFQSFVSLLEANDPVTPDIRELLMVLDDLRRGRMDVALERAESAAAAAPESAEAVALLGAVHLARREDDKAREAFSAALAIDPNNASVRRNLNRLDVRDGNLETVRDRLRQDLDADPGDLQTRVDLALILDRLGDADGAVALIREDSSNEGQFALVAYLNRKGQQEAAREVALKLAGAEEPETVFNAALTLLELGDAASALAAYESLPGAAQSNPGPLVLAARIHIALEDLASARDALIQVREVQGRSQTINSSLMDLHLRLEELAAANALVDDVAEFDPLQATLLRLRIAMDQGGTAEGLAMLEGEPRANEEPVLAQTLFRLRLANDQHDAALEGLRAYVRNNPGDTVAIRLIAGMLLQNEDYTNARVELEQAYRLVPNNPTVLNNLAWVRHKQGAAGAIELAARAYALDPNSGEIADTLGWILVNQGNVDDGLRLLREADQTLEQGNPDVRYHLAFALNMAGEKDDAAQILEEILQPEESFSNRSDAEQLLSELRGR